MKVSQPRSENDRIASFVDDLTRICCKHGIGVESDCDVFMMTGDDYLFSYRIDENGKLTLN
jgi:hypothetical protein